jgi:hypothetical protein
MTTRLLTPRRWIALVAMGLLVLGAACAPLPSVGPAGAPQPGAASQVSEAGQVTITATWQGGTGAPTFTLAMDSHSVDLDGCDLKELAILRTDQGRQVQPTSWDAARGGHHRSGTLSFSPIASDGDPVIGPTTGALELVIRDVAGVPERVLRWAL